MNNNGKFLSSLYRNETITSIIEEAINGKFQLTYIDRDTGVERILLRGDLSAIRDKGCNKKTEVEIEAPSSRLIAGADWLPARREIVSFGRRQNVGYSDLRANDKNLSLIETIFGKGDVQSLLTVQVEQIEQANEDELTEEEANEKYYKNPADRDPRLQEAAIEILIENPDMKLSEIHNQLIEQEKGKSDVSIHVLKYIVQYDDIKRKAKKRIAEKSKSDQVS